MLSFVEDRRIGHQVLIAAALIAAMTLASFHEAKANIKILINESAGEGIGKLTENTTRICGFTPVCTLPIALPVPIDAQVVVVAFGSEAADDIVQFGTVGNITGIIGFFSDAGDTGPGDIDGAHTTTGTGIRKVTVDINIVSPAEAIPELGTWAMMLIGFGLVGVRLRNGRRLDACRLAVS